MTTAEQQREAAVNAVPRSEPVAIAIVGPSCRTAGADHAKTLWQLVTDGRRLVGPVPEGRVPGIDTGPIRFAAAPRAEYRERMIQIEVVDGACSCEGTATRSRTSSSIGSARRRWRRPRQGCTVMGPRSGTGSGRIRSEGCPANGTGTRTTHPGCAPGGLTRRPRTARAPSLCRPSPGGGSSSGSGLLTGCARDHPSPAATGRSAGFSRVPVVSAAWRRRLS
ncbi:beta-ketoacyl synthase N-terminal-like domain-containing protein [Streptomyces hokutonensis]|uniref:Beta-ketoacyl synthase N-terminal-like domain-containing protein n=1 Tax=Streptomyces hokutonensis TaxID=1306990 RepID=A0ABW6M5G7_9ACTN